MDGVQASDEDDGDDFNDGFKDVSIGDADLPIVFDDSHFGDGSVIGRDSAAISFTGWGLFDFCLFVFEPLVTPFL